MLGILVLGFVWRLVIYGLCILITPFFLYKNFYHENHQAKNRPKIEIRNIEQIFIKSKPGNIEEYFCIVKNHDVLF